MHITNSRCYWEQASLNASAAAMHHHNCHINEHACSTSMPRLCHPKTTGKFGETRHWWKHTKVANAKHIPSPTITLFFLVKPITSWRLSTLRITKTKCDLVDHAMSEQVFGGDMYNQKQYIDDRVVHMNGYEYNGEQASRSSAAASETCCIRCPAKKIAAACFQLSMFRLYQCQFKMEHKEEAEHFVRLTSILISKTPWKNERKRKKFQSSAKVNKDFQVVVTRWVPQKKFIQLITCRNRYFS